MFETKAVTWLLKAFSQNIRDSRKVDFVCFIYETIIIINMQKTSMMYVEATAFYNKHLYHCYATNFSSSRLFLASSILTCCCLFVYAAM